MNRVFGRDAVIPDHRSGPLGNAPGEVANDDVLVAEETLDQGSPVIAYPGPPTKGENLGNRQRRGDNNQFPLLRSLKDYPAFFLFVWLG